ncbi:piggyBac transposable element-derived protein 3-like [Cydia fagiglandana]|uniref:piggyBac transposable element-derived protein 3-like n=1 Tax=Cydia fagiglandana TaxID=1458189 RepID=UPI002146CDD5
MAKRLQDRDIEQLLAALEDGNVSEDGLDDENDDEDLFYTDAREILRDLLDEEAFDGSRGTHEERTADTEQDDSDPPLVEDRHDNQHFDKRKLIWKVGHMSYDETKITPDSDIIESTDRTIQDLDTPYQCFNYFFTPDFLQQISDESNLYSCQKDPARSQNITPKDVQQFIGIILFMSVQQFPSVRAYWHEKYGYEPVKSVMPVNKFERIRSLLHFNDNTKHLTREHPDHDRLHKIRPVIEHLNEKFSSIPMDQRLSVDEQMCSTKIGHFLKQYLPNKPHKWGYKLFVLCSLMGYAYRFEVYSGQEKKDRPAGEPDLGKTNNVVLRLARVIPRMRNHIVFFDNFYTSLPLVYHLAKQGIHCVGTVQQNRLPNCRLPDKKEMLKASVPRGTHEERITHFDGIDFSVTAWKDNKIVTLLSDYIGSEPMGISARYDKKQKQKVEIPCPKIVQEYNMHMGGVDLMDSYLGRYRIRVKSRKWYLRLFYHLLDLAVINSWILMKKNCIAKDVPTKQLPNLGQFRNELADVLCNIGLTYGIKRGRPSNASIEQGLQAKKQKGTSHPLPSVDVRKDGFDHWPMIDTRLRCKIPNCNGTTTWSCSKCKVPLCLNPRNNCFTKFHQ